MISEPSYYVGRPVESMQTMLRFAAEGNNRLLPVVPDGVFGPNTMAAVTAFQRYYGLPATGVMNGVTWERLVQTYQAQLVQQAPAEAMQPILNPPADDETGREQLPHLFGTGGAAGPELRVSWPSSDAGERHAGCVHSHGGAPLSGPLRPAGDRRGGPAHLAVSLPPLHPGCRKRNRELPERETINPRGAPAPLRIQWRCGSWPPDVHAGYFSRTAAKARARSARPSPGKAPKEARRTRNGDIRRTDQEMPLSGIIPTPLLTRGGGRW